MLYKHNESRYHKIEKSCYKVANWHDYNIGLWQRGDFMIWFTEEAISYNNRKRQPYSKYIMNNYSLIKRKTSHGGKTYNWTGYIRWWL